MERDRRGKIQTVLGLIEPEQLGETLMHEHVYVDYSPNFKLGDLPGAAYLTDEEEKRIWEEPLAIENTGICRCYFSQSRDNMRLTDINMAIRNTALYKKAGGGALVECSSEGIKADQHPESLVQISRGSGLHVIMGTGAYLNRSHPDWLKSSSVADIEDLMCTNILQGMGGTDIKAGLVGEIGVTTEMTPSEARVLRASIATCHRTGVAMSVHPGYSVAAPSEILSFVDGVGASLDRVVMGHVDRGLLGVEHMAALCRRGATIAFDQFGWPTSFQHSLRYNIHYPSDLTRCDMIRQLWDMGYGDQVVLSHDIAFKTRLVEYGGKSYDHISNNILPSLRLRGLTDKQIKQMVEYTPMRLLTIQ